MKNYIFYYFLPFQRESIRESLKNMLLVMNTTGLFDNNQSLVVMTKDRIQSFFPSLWEEVFKISTLPSMTEVIFEYRINSFILFFL